MRTYKLFLVMSPFTKFLEPKKKMVPSNDLEDCDEYLEQAEGFFLEWEREKPKRFSPEQIRKFTSNFSKSLGSGACGDVYQGQYDGQRVAIKVLKKEVLADNIKDQFVAEVSTLGKTHHRNLVKLYGFCFQPKMKALVYEFMEMESLDKFLKGKSSIKWEMLCNIAIGTAKGLSYLHEDCQPSIIHYDIKPSNILLDSKFSPKIGDFGMARLLKIDVTHVTTSKFRGTPYYSAPELSMPYLKVNHKCDVYSYGMMLFDIVAMGKHKPQETEHWFPRQVWEKYQKGKLEEVMADCIEAKDRAMAKKILMIALSCVEFWASRRPSMKDVVRLLEGAKDPLMPHNCVLPSMKVSRSVAPIRKGDPRGVDNRSKFINNWRGIEKVQANFDAFLWELKFFPPANVIQKLEGYSWVEGVSEEVRQDQASKPNLNKKSHFPLFMFALFLILFLKFHVAPLFVWFKKLV